MDYKKYYSIGEVSKLCNIPIRTLHYYNEIELLIPEKVDETSGYRYYSHEQLMHVYIVKEFKFMGFSLKEVGSLLKREDIEFNKDMLKVKCDEIDKSIKELEILKNRLKRCVQNMDEKQNNVDIKDLITNKSLKEKNIVYLRFNGRCSLNEFITRFLELNKLIEKHKLHVSGHRFAIFYGQHNKIDYENADIELCLPIDDKLIIEGVTRKMPGFDALVATHYGRYSSLDKTYRKIGLFAKENGYQILENVVNNFIVDSVSTMDEEEYITEVIMPIK